MLKLLICLQNSPIFGKETKLFFSTKIDEQNLFQREKNRFQYVALFPTSGLKEHEKATNFSSISMLLKNSLWSRNKKFPRTHKKKKSNSDFTFCLDQTRFLFALKSHSWHEKKSFFHTLAQKIRKFPRKIRTDLLKPALLPVVVLAAASVDFCESSAQLKKKKNKKKREKEKKESVYADIVWGFFGRNGRTLHESADKEEEGTERKVEVTE